MLLSEAALALLLLGLAAYMALAGADFGTGVWVLTAGTDPAGRRIRARAHRSMAPVWEANHVWLIFVLVLAWTAFPTALASLASTLAIPLLVAMVGIVLRGAAYALRAVTRTERERGILDRLFAVSSVLTPFALGSAIGGIASGRVPVGNEAGSLLGSWLNPTSIAIGAIAVASAAHLAAVYLAADTSRVGEPELIRPFRARALISGLVAGALALAGLAVVRGDAPRLFAGLTSGAGLGAVTASGAAGILSLVLVAKGRYGWARLAAASAVAAIIAGWAAAQQPYILPGLPLAAAAASTATLVTVLVVFGIGALIVFPSLTLLFSLFLRGWFDRPPSEEAITATGAQRQSRVLWLPLAAILSAGTALTVVADGGWVLGVGVAGLMIFVAGGFVFLAGPMTAEPEEPAATTMTHHPVGPPFE